MTSLFDDMFGSSQAPQPHDWDYGKTPWQCKRCFAKWEANASPIDVQKFLSPTCTGMFGIGDLLRGAK